MVHADHPLPGPVRIAAILAATATVTTTGYLAAGSPHKALSGEAQAGRGARPEVSPSRSPCARSRC